MSDSDLTEEQKAQVERAKRAVWQQEGAAKEYQYFAYRADPLLRVKNFVEMSFVLRHALGPRVLDAGAGTGRFTLPLSQRQFHVAAVDISREMLGQGIAGAAKVGQTFPCLLGDIERLPFPDGAFDCVVSITVLRHFPRWPDILREYARVVRTGGRIIFDLVSGTQRLFLKQLGIGAAEGGGEDPLGFEAAATASEVEAVANERGLRVRLVAPHDFLNNNPLLDHALADSKEEFMKALVGLFGNPVAMSFFEMLAGRFLAALSPALTPSILVVAEKVTGTPAPFRVPYKGLPRSVLKGASEDQLIGVLKHSLGRRFEGCLREAANGLVQPEAAQLVQFLRESLLPVIPTQALWWDESPP